MIAVLVVSLRTEPAAALLLPRPTFRQVHHDRVYRLYNMPSSTGAPTNFEPFVTIQTFASLDEANAWIRRDAEQRAALHAAPRTIA